MAKEPSRNILEEPKLKIEEFSNFITPSISLYHLMLRNCGNEIVEGRYIQKPDKIISQNNNVVKTQRLLNVLLDNMEKELSNKTK